MCPAQGREMAGHDRVQYLPERAAVTRAARRTVLKGGLASLASAALQPLSALAETDTQPVVNDVTLLNPIRVADIATPHSGDDVKHLVSTWLGSISIGGARYSMGGQIAAEDSLHLDMRGLNQPVWFDPQSKTIRVQTGMRWRDLQTIIDSHELAVKIMQSYSNFTIGGTLSVNAHGRYVGLGPLINSVRAIQIVLPGGVAVEASPVQDAELFYGAIGGYGGLGIVTEVELDLVSNVRIERRVHRAQTSEYPAFFLEQVLGQTGAIFHNADLDPPDLNAATMVTWFQTDKPVTIVDRLFSANESYGLEAFEIWALAELPGAHLLRRNFIDPIANAGDTVVWRNHEASLDVASLGPIATKGHTYALQEYFIPVSKFAEFAANMARILRANEVNALNVSVRHSPPDRGSLLAWAREAVFSFVLYYRQRSSLEAQQQVGNWTRQLIEASISSGGTYYLPYQLHATKDQFDRAYPGAAKFFALKSRVDPGNQFRNRLWNKYRVSS
jgi:FAD/FMN-containing dehydrogenase